MYDAIFWFLCHRSSNVAYMIYVRLISMIFWCYLLVKCFKWLCKLRFLCISLPFLFLFCFLLSSLDQYQPFPASFVLQGWIDTNPHLQIETFPIYPFLILCILCRIRFVFFFLAFFSSLKSRFLFFLCLLVLFVWATTARSSMQCEFV